MNTIVFNRKHYCFFTLNSYKSWRRSRRLRTLAIGRESEIARREHTRLGVLYIHIMHTRQVAHAARYHHEALVLDRP